MHKPQKKHNEIRGYVKRVFYARAVTPLYPRKKSRGLKTSAFMLFIRFHDREPAFYHRSHFTVSRHFTIGRILTVSRHFYHRSAFLRRKDYSSVKASLLRPHTGQTQSSGTSSHLVPGATPLPGSPRVSS